VRSVSVEPKPQRAVTRDRGHRDVVPPSLAEFCVALDVPLGLLVLVLAAA
jgi:hypothetical protein